MPVKLASLRENPKNPRRIKDDQFEKLILSLRHFPKMLTKRPIVFDDNVALGGNMRLKAIRHIAENPEDFDDPAWQEVRKTKAVPDSWITDVTGWDEKEKKQFVIKDNLQYGEWDWDSLIGEWDTAILNDWGLPVPVYDKAFTDQVNQQDEWVNLPEFNAKDAPIRMVISFESEQDRETFNEKFNMQAIKMTKKVWSTWWPFKGKEDLKSIKYEAKNEA